MWSNDRPTTPGFYWCHQHGKTRIVDIWCYKNGTELFTNEDGGASIKDTLYDGTQWMAAVIPPNPQDQNESTQPTPSVPDFWPIHEDPFAYVIQHLNSNPYPPTKDEAITLIKELRALHNAAPEAKP